MSNVFIDVNGKLNSKGDCICDDFCDQLEDEIIDGLVSCMWDEAWAGKVPENEIIKEGLQILKEAIDIKISEL